MSERDRNIEAAERTVEWLKSHESALAFNADRFGDDSYYTIANRVHEVRQGLESIIEGTALTAPVECENETERVMRVVLVDHTSEYLGRIYDKWGVRVEIQRQDDGRTLKVFVTDRCKSGLRDQD